MNSPLLEKSLDFATQIVLFYEEFSKVKKDTTIAKQLLRLATRSALISMRRSMVIVKLTLFLNCILLSRKQGESIYWLTLLERTKLIEYNYSNLITVSEEIRRMLVASLNTAKTDK